MPSNSALVINTGPLLALIAATGDLKLLRQVSPKTIVPLEVVNEILEGGKHGFGVDAFREESWLDRRSSATSIPPFLSNATDLGEASVIALALAESMPAVCLDDQEARRTARLCGLKVTGSLGILIAAKQSGAEVDLRAAIERMRQHGIWLSEHLVKNVLQNEGI